ncbi:MAG: ribosome silencing factor [Thermosynechococcaceae cyanobacterium MS004]|nr:ribosome silencing factor [Thermosynechococcaceae cyanobacterium MS004]
MPTSNPQLSASQSSVSQTSASQELNNLQTTDSVTTTPSPNQILSRQLALTLAQAADDRKGANILILNVQDVSYLADFFVIVTGFSRPQVRALSDAMETAAAAQGRIPEHIEGVSESTWVVLDYGDVIAHIMMPDQREYYSLEAFWGHAEQVPLPQSSSPVSASIHPELP